MSGVGLETQRAFLGGQAVGSVPLVGARALLLSAAGGLFRAAFWSPCVLWGRVFIGCFSFRPAVLVGRR